MIQQQPFGKSCNLTIEYPCLPINMSDFSNDNRPCIDLKLIGNGRTDCIGGYDERSAINYCDSVTTLGYNFKCLSSNTCIDYSRICTPSGRCPNISDDDIWCRNHVSIQNWQFTIFRCINGTFISNSRCDGKYDCFDGEDEYMCPSDKSSNTIYRKQKELDSRTIQQKLQLPQFPIATNTTTTFESGSLVLSKSTLQHPMTPYWCNRGIGTFTSNGSIVCFCPPQYHGDQCQYHSDRITVILHLNLTQSTYTTSTDQTTVIKLLVLFLSHNQVLGTEEFHVRPTTEIISPKKKRTYFHYSRSLQSLETKKNRYFDRLNVINQHPYSIRIEAYEMKTNEKPKRFAVWQYPIYFDYLPVYRFAKVLRLAKLDSNDLCNPNPCNGKEECYPLMNEQSQHICLCKNNFFGPNCSNTNSDCMSNYCSPNALCQPSYRGLLNSADLPYCICPIDHIGQRCELFRITCSSNPCKNGGTCYQISRLDDYYCECTVEYEGKTCEDVKPTVKLYINQNNTIKYDGIVIQYFKIHFSTFKLDLVNQSVYSKLPDFLFYLHSGKIAPEIILLKTYVQEQAEIYLLSLHLDASSIDANTSISEKNHCKHVRSLFSTEKSM